MSSSDLLSRGKISVVERGDVDFGRVDSDLSVARKNIEDGVFDWGFSIAYHAVLRAGMGFMSFSGYKTRGGEHHKSVFLFLRDFEGFEDLARYFDRIRRKRNEFVYRGSEDVSGEEAREVLKMAEDFVSKMRTFVLENGTGGGDED